MLTVANTMNQIQDLARRWAESCDAKVATGRDAATLRSKCKQAADLSETEARRCGFSRTLGLTHTHSCI